MQTHLKSAFNWVSKNLYQSNPSDQRNKANFLSQLELKLTSKLLEARENANDHVPIVLISLVSDWLIGWREFSRPIIEQS